MNLKDSIHGSDKGLYQVVQKPEMQMQETVVNDNPNYNQTKMPDSSPPPMYNSFPPLMHDRSLSPMPDSFPLPMPDGFQPPMSDRSPRW